MVKLTQIIRRLLPTICLSVFDHFVGLALNGFMLIHKIINVINLLIYYIVNIQMVYKILNMLMHKIINIYLYAQNNPVVVLKNCGPELV